MMFKWCVFAALLPLSVQADEVDASVLIGAMSDIDVPVMQLAEDIPAILGATIRPEVGLSVAQSQYFTEDDAQGLLT